MAEADLGKIVSMILENPELVEKIKSMSEAAGAPMAEKPVGEVPAEGEEDKAASTAVSASIPPANTHGKRNELLRALKSFLSDDRRKSLETMITIADVLDTMRSR